MHLGRGTRGAGARWGAVRANLSEINHHQPGGCSLWRFADFNYYGRRDGGGCRRTEGGGGGRRGGGAEGFRAAGPVQLPTGAADMRGPGRALRQRYIKSWLYLYILYVQLPTGAAAMRGPRRALRSRVHPGHRCRHRPLRRGRPRLNPGRPQPARPTGDEIPRPRR